MRLIRPLLPLVALLLLSTCAAKTLTPLTPPTSPPPLAPRTRVLRAMGRLEAVGPDGYGSLCTAFAVAPRVYLSAAHCVADISTPTTILIDRRPVMVEKIDVARDLIRLVAYYLDKPPLTIRTAPLVLEERIFSLGYGYGWGSPIGFSHRVLLVNYPIPADAEDTIWPGTIVSGGFVGGMSGGPLWDSAGDVVGMVQRSTPQVGYGVNAATLLEFVAE